MPARRPARALAVPSWVARWAAHPHSPSLTGLCGRGMRPTGAGRGSPGFGSCGGGLLSREGGGGEGGCARCTGGGGEGRGEGGGGEGGRGGEGDCCGAAAAQVTA